MMLSKRGNFMKKIFMKLVFVGFMVFIMIGGVVVDDDIIKVGILYFFFGMMVIFEIMFKDVMLMFIEE